MEHLLLLLSILSFVERGYTICSTPYREEAVGCFRTFRTDQWYTFDPSNKTCVNVTYSGCGGSGNLFMQNADCENNCIRDVALSCTEMQRVPTKCQIAVAYYFDSINKECSTVETDTCEWNGTKYFSSMANCQEICGQNGNWAAWENWGTCSTTCRGDGLARRARLRKCSDPYPDFGGKPCAGPNIEYEPCYHCSLNISIINCEGETVSLNSSHPREDITYYKGRINIESMPILHRCTWLISVPQGYVSYIQITEVDVPGNETYNKIKIYDVDNGNESLVETLSRGSKYSRITSTTLAKIQIESFETAAFNATIAIFPKVCRNSTEKTEETIPLPTLEGTLPSNLDCQFSIHSEDRRFLTLTFVDLYLSFGCRIEISSNFPLDNTQVYILSETNDPGSKNFSLKVYGSKFHVRVQTDSQPSVSRIGRIHFKASSPRECLNKMSPTSYEGTVNKTSSGKNCRNWGPDQSTLTPPFPNNFCRFFNGSERPVCYVNDQRNIVEQCNITTCVSGPAGKPSGGTDDEENLKSNIDDPKDGSTGGFVGNEYIVMGVVSAALLISLLVIALVIAKQRRKQRVPRGTNFPNGREENDENEKFSVRVNCAEGTAAFSKATNLYDSSTDNPLNSNKQNDNIDYAEVSNTADDNAYACADTDLVTGSGNSKAGDDSKLYSETAYDSVDRRNSNEQKSKMEESNYGGVAENEYDVLRKTRKPKHDSEHDNLYGAADDTYSESILKRSNDNNFDESEYGVGINLK